MGDDRESFDWARFVVHFVIGAVFGAFLGVGWSASSGSIHWPAVIGVSLGVGILGGFFGDAFWTRFISALRWWV